MIKITMLLLCLILITTCTTDSVEVKYLTKNQIDEISTLLDKHQNAKGVAEIKKLIANGNLEETDEAGDSPLMKTSFSNNTEIVAALIDLGANINATNNYGTSPLMRAAYNNNEDVVALLLENGAKLETKDKDGDTALTLANKREHNEIVAMLIEAGANKGEVKIETSETNIIDNPKSLEELFLEHEGNYSIGRTKELFESGGLNVHDKDGNTVLMLASESQYKDIVQALIDKGSNVNARNDKGDTALMIALTFGHSWVAKILIEAGALVNTANIYNETALHYAAKYGDGNIIKLLIKAGADVNVQNNDGETSLIILAYDGGSGERIRVALEALYEANPDFTIKNNNGETALDVASKNEYIRDDLKIFEQMQVGTYNPNNNPQKIALLEILKNKDKIIKANNIVGYKGKAKIKVEWYEEGYAYKGSKDNVGKIYDVYIDSPEKNKSSIIFYETPHNKELEINIEKDSLYFKYDGEYYLISDDESLVNFLNIKGIEKYPDSIIGLFNINGIINMKQGAEYYIEEVKMRVDSGYYEYDDYNYNVDFNDNYEIVGVYTGDNGDSFSWYNGVLTSLFQGRMGEGIEIKFLDSNGFIRE